MREASDGVEGTAPVQPKRYHWDQETDDTFGFMVGPVPDGEWVKWADVAHVFGVPACRVLDASDPFCPKCGHNRDRSSVSSVDHGDGRRSCQKCGAAWIEPASGVPAPRGGDALGTLEAALEWHRGDKWRAGTPDQADAWRVQRERLEAAIEALHAGVLGTQGDKA